MGKYSVCVRMFLFAGLSKSCLFSFVHTHFIHGPCRLVWRHDLMRPFREQLQANNRPDPILGKDDAIYLG